MKIWHWVVIASIVIGALQIPLKEQYGEIAYRIIQLETTIFLIGIGIIAAIELEKKGGDIHEEKQIERETTNRLR